ncbi:MAG: hypothetical protein KC591_09360, partial [Gemmatimonadetes bacterium]|nr:hypothetical protein [Gemmatimonadota bacterium]
MRELLLEEVKRSVKSAYPEIGEDLLGRLTLEAPRDPSHGDFASNAAFLLKDLVRDNPRKIAEALVAQLAGETAVSDAEVAGPGFINFKIRPRGIQTFLRQLADLERRRALLQDPEWARHIGKFQIEFVSANPTGPMNVVSARSAAFGDACVRLQRAVGVDVHAEYYVNDEGNQAQLFGESLRARFLEAAGEKSEFPEEGYRGEYVTELGRELWRGVSGLADRGHGAAAVAAAVAAHAAAGGTIRALEENVHVGAPPAPEPAAAGANVARAVAESLDFSSIGIASMIEAAKAALRSFGVEFDVWFRESVLHREDSAGAVRLLEAEKQLQERGHVRGEDGAHWFTSTEFGDDKDRVIRRSNGQSTYLLADIAYHLDKARR